MAQYNLVEGTPQYQFHQSRKKLQVFGGGFANGKTTALAVKALRIARDYPGSNGLLARSTYPKLNDTLRKVFFQWCPEHWVKRKPSQDDNTCILANGSTINFRYIAQRGKTTETGDTTSNLLSATYDWIGVDQIEDPEITHKDFLDLFGRLRGDTPYRPIQEADDETMPDTGPRWLMVTLNPTRNWFYREVVQPFHQFDKRGIFSEKLLVDPESHLPIMELCEGSTYTNERNLKADYVRSLETMYRGQMKDRYLLGKWAAYEGLVYPSFDPEVHLLKRDFAESYLEDQINDKHVQVVALEGYDFGITSPSCYLLGFVDGMGRIIILDGYYKPNFAYPEQPLEIMKIRGRYPLEYEDKIIADPSIFRKQVVSHQTTGESVHNLLRTGNDLRFRMGTNDITAGIAKVSAYLSGIDIPHLVTGDRPSPLLYFVDDLHFIEDEIGAYYWKKNPQGIQLDEPQGDTDHAMDTLKYMLSFRPMPSEVQIPRDQIVPQYMYWHETEEQDRR